MTMPRYLLCSASRRGHHLHSIGRRIVGFTMLVALLETAWCGAAAVAAGTDLTVFVTNETFLPGSEPGLLGGVAESDQKCQDRAQLAGLSGTFKAWLSDGGTSAADRQGHSLTPYVLVDGTTVVASDWADLTDGTLQHAIDRDEYGNPTSGVAVWTGTAADGTTVADDTCLGWFSSVGSGRRGTSSGVDATWTTNADGDCSTLAHLYCIQQCPDIDMDGFCDAPAPPTTTIASTTTTIAPTTTIASTTTTIAPTTTIASTTTTTLPSLDGLHFTTGDLNDGAVYGAYGDTLAVAGGTPPYQFAVNPGTVTVDGTSYPSLAAIGLLLGKSNGRVSGIPLVPGVVAFQATCTDANGTVAQSDDGTTPYQPVTFAIDAGGGQLTSSFVIASLTIKSGFGAGKDSLTCKGIVNIGGGPASTLSGAALTFRALGYVTPAVTFDAKGNAASAKGRTPSVKGSVKKTGAFSLSVAKDTIDLGGPASGTMDVVLGLTIGDAVEGSQVLRLSVKSATKGGRTLAYKGDSAGDLGGSFMVLKVTGADDKGGTGDAWKVSFVERPPANVDVTAASTATVVVGSSSYQISLLRRGSRLAWKGAKDAAVRAFSLDNRIGKGSYTTGLLTSASTGIARAGTSGSGALFQTQVVLSGQRATPLIAGTSRLRLSSTKNKWKSQ